MEMIIFTGVQASGKSTFYLQSFFRSHLRINLDMLKRRSREQRLIEACLQVRQKFVVDNTNPGRKDRARYFELAADHCVKPIAYFFDTTLRAALSRNAKRDEEQRIPDKGVRATFGKIEPPSYDEGFDEIFRVRIRGRGFEVSRLAAS